MPVIKELGYYSGVVKKVEFDEQYGSLQFTCETQTDQKSNDLTIVPSGSHGYPSCYLQESPAKGGGENKKTFETLEKMFGWKGDSIEELEKLALDKSIRFSVKQHPKKEDKVVYYLAAPRPLEAKPMDVKSAAGANAFLKNLRNGTLAPKQDATPAPAHEDLHIEPENIPF